MRVHTSFFGTCIKDTTSTTVNISYIESKKKTCLNDRDLKQTGKVHMTINRLTSSQLLTLRQFEYCNH